VKNSLSPRMRRKMSLRNTVGADRVLCMIPHARSVHFRCGDAPRSDPGRTKGALRVPGVRQGVPRNLQCAPIVRPGRAPESVAALKVHTLSVGSFRPKLDPHGLKAEAVENKGDASKCRLRNVVTGTQPADVYSFVVFPQPE
jgi:hypothetical protein